MLIFWSTAIVAGLLVLVYLMIAGVPRLPTASSGPGGKPRTALPVLGAFSTSAGIAGYLTMNSTHPQAAPRIALVVGVASLAALATRWLVVRAFTEPPPDPEDDPRYRYQGQVGRVTRAITAEQPGWVAFEADDQRFELVARSIDGEPLAENVEVVIERIDDNVATVEPWATVERRL